MPTDLPGWQHQAAAQQAATSPVGMGRVTFDKCLGAPALASVHSMMEYSQVFSHGENALGPAVSARSILQVMAAERDVTTEMDALRSTLFLTCTEQFTKAVLPLPSPEMKYSFSVKRLSVPGAPHGSAAVQETISLLQGAPPPSTDTADLVLFNVGRGVISLEVVSRTLLPGSPNIALVSRLLGLLAKRAATYRAALA